MPQDRSFESSLHDIVYSIDTGTGLKIIRASLYTLFLVVLILLYTATQFRGLKDAEAMDLAQVGRNITLQGGMQTKCVRPLTMWKISQVTPEGNPRILNHPDILHAPAYPAVLAIGFKIFDLMGVDIFSLSQRGGSVLPAEQWLLIPINHLFAALTGFIVYMMGGRLFSKEIGFLGMTTYFLSNVVWADSISGLGITMACFFSAAAFYCIVVSMLNRRDRDSMAAWAVPFILSILFAAGAFLTRYITVAIVPGMAFYAWLMAGRFRGGTRYAIVIVLLFGVIVSPWLYRNFKLCGNPMGMAAYTVMIDTSKYPDNALERSSEPEFKAKSVWTNMKHKWIKNYSGEYQNRLPAMGGGVLMALFLTTFLYHFVRPQVNCLRWGVGLSILLMMIVAGFFGESTIRMLHIFWPFVVLYSLAFFTILIDRLDLGLRLYNLILKCAIVAVAALPLVFTLLPPHGNHPYPPYYAPIISQVSNMLTPREVMCTDMPWATAWYGDRVSVLLPQNLDDFYEINDYKQYISGLYITTLTKNKPFVRALLDGPEKSWLPILSGRYPPDFPLKKGVALNRQDQIFISDRDRWSSAKK
ncbi:MAG: glycosyltransferase family 39 protein [Kiritimatiellales bacterium]|nr:glycosyltransferase family 39 protein [Kiritimatiellales bacterium]